MWNCVEFWIGIQPTAKMQRCSLRLPPFIDFGGFCHRMSARLIVESEQVLDATAAREMGDFGLVQVSMPVQ
eukprot:11478142-Alexandrium_andersonii.AAC.1